MQDARHGGHSLWVRHSEATKPMEEPVEFMHQTPILLLVGPSTMDSLVEDAVDGVVATLRAHASTKLQPTEPLRPRRQTL